MPVMATAGPSDPERGHRVEREAGHDSVDRHHQEPPDDTTSGGEPCPVTAHVDRVSDFQYVISALASSTLDFFRGRAFYQLLNMDDKQDIAHTEDAHATERGIITGHGTLHFTNNQMKHGDAALAVIGDERVELTEEDNRRIRRKTDLHILPILIWVYFLQVMDKTTLGYAAVFGLQSDTHLTGKQYSLVGSISPIAQLAVQPFTNVLIVWIPPRILMPILITGWGVAQASMAACHDYSGLLATRFFLGLFEAGCLPMFSMITSHWYRRSEQPLRVAAWYSMNGIVGWTSNYEPLWY